MKYFLSCLGAIFLLAGCKGGVDKTLSDLVEESCRLPEEGTLRVKNEDGTIRLYGADVSELHFKALKRAYSEERLKALDVRLASHDDAVSLETSFPPRKKWGRGDRSGTVDYTIVMPQHLKKIELQLTNGEISIDGLRSGTARATVQNGRLSARNCFADLDYLAQNGAIDFYFNWWEAGTYMIKAAIPNGSVGLLVPPSASFHLQAETRGGSITGNLINGDEDPHEHRKKLDTAIGSGEGPTFQLHSGNGNIRLHGY